MPSSSSSSSSSSRQFGDDNLYKAIFHEYVTVLLQKGGFLECFIEGGRSRSGKVLSPKAGFLKIVVDAVASKRVDEAMLLPISISYDKVIEGQSYTAEMLGARKQKETLSQFINSAQNVVRLNFGSIDIKIHKARSLHKLIFATPTYGPSYQDDSRRFILALCHRVLYETNMGVTTTATSIVAAVLLTTINRGIHINELIDRVDWLKDAIVSRGGRVARIFATEKTPVIVERALRVLGKLVQRQNNVLYGFKHVESLELSYYRNQLLHFFISEALVCIALAAEFKEAHEIGQVPLAISTEKLLQSVKFVSQLLKFEFIYKPTPDIADNFEHTIESMKKRGILAPADMDGTSVKIDPNGKDMFQFLCMCIWPFIDAYWITVSSLFALRPNRLVQESRIIRLASRRADALYYSGNIDFFESVSTDIIKQAVAWCLSQRVIAYQTVETDSGTKTWKKPGERLLQLAPEYCMSAASSKNDVPVTIAADTGPVRASKIMHTNNVVGSNSATVDDSKVLSPAIASSHTRPFAMVEDTLSSETSMPHKVQLYASSSPTPSAPSSSFSRKQNLNELDQHNTEMHNRLVNERDRTSTSAWSARMERGDDRLLALLNYIGAFRKKPMSKRDPNAVLRHYADIDLSSSSPSQLKLIAKILRPSKL
jgi:glycerol-3-phosphate O-acyltransferase